VPLAPERRVDPRQMSELPSFVQRVAPSIVGLRVQVDEGRPSAATLGTRRFASAVLFDPRGYALTVSYVLLDAATIEARTRANRTVAARLVGIDLDAGLGIVKLEGDGPWPAAALNHSRDLAVGAVTGTVGVDEDGDLVSVVGAVHGIRRFSARWEYMLERALIVAPSSPSWGGSAVVDTAGAVVAIASLRLGDPPHVNLAIPLDSFLPVKDELVRLGRVASRPARPWLGLYTITADGALLVDGFSSAGPARHADLRRGDRIVAVDGVTVHGQEEFYAQLWRARAGDVIRLGVVRDQISRVVEVRSVDRGQVFRTTGP
jgi:S1-C subfamily serine protease